MSFWQWIWLSMGLFCISLSIISIIFSSDVQFDRSKSLRCRSRAWVSLHWRKCVFLCYCMSLVSFMTAKYSVQIEASRTWWRVYGTPPWEGKQLLVQLSCLLVAERLCILSRPTSGYRWVNSTPDNLLIFGSVSLLTTPRWSEYKTNCTPSYLKVWGGSYLLFYIH